MDPIDAGPSRGELHLAQFASRHLLKPILLLSTEFALYLFCIVIAIRSDHLSSKLGGSFLAGILTATLAIIGHDCAHRGGTRLQWLNRLIATVGFLPALHPLSRWEHHHNQVHHRYTAQLGRDNAFPPMTLHEYRAASKAHRLYYRFLRSIWGQPFFYLLQIWCRDIILPRPVSFIRRDWFDFSLVCIWATLLIVGGTVLYYESHLSQEWGLAVTQACLFGLIIPFLVWNILIAFVTVTQHTGPDVRWSVPTGRPSTLEQKVRGTVRICFPDVIDKVLFHRLMQHPAHHINPVIPLYSLKAAQQRLEDLEPEGLMVIRWTPGYHFRLTRTCKLYDPNCDRWCDFQGRVTA